jgi:hypothetical protein
MCRGYIPAATPVLGSKTLHFQFLYFLERALMEVSLWNLEQLPVWWPTLSVIFLKFFQWPTSLCIKSMGHYIFHVGFAWKYCKYRRCSSYGKIVNDISLSDHFWPRFQAFGGWNEQYICFRFGRPCTVVPERANRSNEKIDSPSVPLHYCWSFLHRWSEFEERGFEQQLWICPSSRLNSRSGFLWLLMFHCSVQTCIARTLTFSSFVHRLFWFFVLCCYAPSILVILVQVRIVGRLRQFWVRTTVNT